MLELFSHIFHMPFTCLPLVVTEVTRKGKKSENVCSFLSFVITLNFNVVMGSDLLSELKHVLFIMFLVAIQSYQVLSQNKTNFNSIRILHDIKLTVCFKNKS